MKQIIIFSLALGMLIFMAALSPKAYAHHGPAHAQTAAAGSPAAVKKPLIVYFSHSGNTKLVADMIRRRVGGDFFEIVTQAPYPSEYRATTAQARKELNDGFRPALKISSVPNLETYDVVFLGYPNWWSSIPPAVMTFLEANDMSGKQLIPFVTHGGGGMAGVREISRLAPHAALPDGLAVNGNRAESAQNDVDAWLRKIGMLTGEVSA